MEVIYRKGKRERKVKVKRAQGTRHSGTVM